MPQDRHADVDEGIMAICRRDSRYRPEAYRFMYEALDFTLKSLGEHRHVTGRELCEGIRRFALQRFGMLAPEVFGAWGIRRTDDFGEIVWALVQNGLMGRTEQDSRDDFRDVYDFRKAFVDDFQLDARLN